MRLKMHHLKVDEDRESNTSVLVPKTLSNRRGGCCQISMKTFDGYILKELDEVKRLHRLIYFLVLRQ